MKHTNREIKIRASIISFIIGISIFSVFFNIISLNYNKNEQAEKMRVLEDLIEYKSRIENEINSRVQLLNGYLAFIKTYPTEGAEKSLVYIENLVNRNDKIIRNLSIIKDTTIVWTYPKEGNEKAIGVNLLGVPKQRDSILFVKNNGVVLFDGPVNLIQGGTGFIARVPVYEKNNKYWGQMSIVMNSEELEKIKLDFEKENSLKLSLYNKKDFPEAPFWGSKILEKEEPFIFETSINNLEWVIAAVPSEGWKNFTYAKLVWNILSLLLASTLGILIYNYIYSSYLIKEKFLYDALTGAYSRAFLDAYVPIVFSKAERNGNKVGVLVIDLNDFKSINDKYGHLAGDRALQLFSNTLKTLCRKNDSIARIGGDEFLVIFDEIKSEKDFIRVIEKFEKNSKLTLVFNKNKINFTYSIGGAMYPEDGKDIDEIISIADKKMYINKKIYKQKKSSN